MLEVVELPDRAALVAHLKPAELVSVDDYHCFDERIGWQTYIVMVREYGQIAPAGFTNGPVT